MKRYVSEFYSDLFSVYQQVPNSTVCEDLRAIYSAWLKNFIADYEAVKCMVDSCEKNK